MSFELVDLLVSAVDAAFGIDAEDGLEKIVDLSAVSDVRCGNGIAVLGFLLFQPLQYLFYEFHDFYLNIHEDGQLLLAFLSVHRISQQLQTPSVSAV